MLLLLSLLLTTSPVLGLDAQPRRLRNVHRMRALKSKSLSKSPKAKCPKGSKGPSSKVSKGPGTKAPKASKSCIEPSSESPTLTPCLVEAGLACANQDGTGCDTLPRQTDLVCSTNQPIQSLTFSVDPNAPCRAEPPNNEQDGDEFSCEDGGTFTSASTLIEIECFAGSTADPLTVTPSSVAPFTGLASVTNPLAPDLPSRIICEMTANNDEWSMQVSFITDGESPIFLKDGFGALFVERCTLADDTVKSCKDELTFEASVVNAGGKAFTQRSSTFSFDGETLDLSSGPNPIDPGEERFPSTSEGLTFLYEVCTPTTLTDTASFVFETVEGCGASADTEINIITPPTASPTPSPTPIPRRRRRLF